MSTDSEDGSSPLKQLGDRISKIAGPPKSHYLAMSDEAMRMALRRVSGGIATPSEQIDGDLWLSRALRSAVEVLDLNFDYGADSLQRRLLEQLHDKNSEAGVWDQFEKALLVRREALYDVASRALTGKSYKGIRKQIGDSATVKVASWAPGISGITERAREITHAKLAAQAEEASKGFRDYSEFALARLAAEFPEQVLPSAEFRQMMDLALLGGRGSELITSIAAEIAKAEINSKILGMKDAVIVMAVNWTNPEFPLWLASERALAAILRGPFGLDEVTEAGVRKTRNEKLKCDSPYPILDYKVFRDGRSEFQVSPGLRADPDPL